jgi:hypothetical protein
VSSKTTSAFVHQHGLILAKGALLLNFKLSLTKSALTLQENRDPVMS